MKTKANTHLVELMPLGLVFLLWQSSAVADISFDHSAVVPNIVQGHQLTGDMTIRADYGKLVGSNLFHSFEQFNIGQGQSATFTNDGVNAAIHNVIGRVTGGFSSNIDGLLRSTIPNANVYLLNPNGIVFAPHAQLDIQGAFHASTASVLNFKDGGHFDSLAINNDLLTTASPQDFGFLANSANNNGTITINGAQLDQSFTNLKTLDLAAGNISIENNAVVTLPTGEIRLVAMQGKGEVSAIPEANGILPLPTTTPNADNAGNITIQSGEDNPNTPLLVERSKLVTSGNGAGRISLWGGDISFNNARAFADNKANIYDPEAKAINASAEKGIIIQANNLVVDNSFISTEANQANGASIHAVSTGETIIRNGAGIEANVVSKGHGGNLIISADKLIIDGQGDSSQRTGIYADVLSNSIQGNAGSVQVNAKHELDILNQAHISSYTQSTGQAGKVTVQAETLNIANDGYISSNSYATGNTQTVTVNAQTINIADGGAISSNTLSEGYAKDVNVQADLLNITSGGKISASTSAIGNVGNINLNIGKHLIIDGSGENNSSRPTGIFSEATEKNSGNSGSVTINNSKTLEVLIENGGKISSTTLSNKGNAGNIVIMADTLTIDGQKSHTATGIYSETASRNKRAGDIFITTNKVAMKNNSEIFANTNSQDKAGNIILTTKDNISLDNSRIGSSTFGYGADGGTITINSPTLILNNNAKISATANKEATGGNIIIDASTFNLLNRSEISARNVGSGNAGTIDITAKDSAVLENNSQITVASNQKNAGNIYLNALNRLYLLNSQLTTSAAEGKGNGGDIRIGHNLVDKNLFDPTFVVLNKSAIVANALRGNGGKIDILTHYFLQSTDSIVQASSQFGLQGSISISSANSNIAGSIAVLTGTFMDSARLVQEDCNKRYAQNSSFVVRSGNMVLPSPDNRLNYIPSSLEGCLTSF
ncbi:MAG: filamentous hemagglutinin N-terminal domain-containing protein [Methylococcaceae bacterium]